MDRASSSGSRGTRGNGSRTPCSAARRVSRNRHGERPVRHDPRAAPLLAVAAGARTAGTATPSGPRREPSRRRPITRAEPPGTDHDRPAPPPPTSSSTTGTQRPATTSASGQSATSGRAAARAGRRALPRRRCSAIPRAGTSACARFWQEEGRSRGTTGRRTAPRERGATRSRGTAYRRAPMPRAEERARRDERPPVVASRRKTARKVRPKPTAESSAAMRAHEHAGIPSTRVTTPDGEQHPGGNDEPREPAVPLP